MNGKRMMETQFLKSQELRVIRLEAGEVKLPILYQEASSMWALFPVPSAPLKALIPNCRLKLIPLLPGFTLVGIACLEYKQSDLGSYNEVGIFFPVRYRPRLNLPLVPLLFEEAYEDMGLYIHRLPVTTEVALEAGQRIWGYPKFIADIAFEEAGDWRTCQLTEAGQRILELSIRIPQTGSLRRRDLTTFSVLEGRLLITTVNVQASMHSTRNPKAAQLTLGPHPYGEELKAWHLSTRAIETRFYTHMQVQLNDAYRTEPLQG